MYKYMNSKLMDFMPLSFRKVRVSVSCQVRIRKFQKFTKVRKLKLANIPYDEGYLKEYTIYKTSIKRVDK